MPKLPECKNPDHLGKNRNTMVCSEERQDCFVFYCKLCAEYNIQSIQVKTKAAMRDASRRDLEKRNMLLKAPPPRMKQINMDSSLREERQDRYSFEQIKKSRRA
jgi:hypothetical protein